MINKKMEAAINEQINAEFYSAYFYLSMAAYFETLDLEGCSNWMQTQYKEEIAHTMKFFHYLNERGGKVVLKGVAEPPHSWESPMHVFQETLKHEEHVTSLINGLMDLALSERDHATTNFLQWYVEEQVEEEATVGAIISKLKMVAHSPESLFLLDKELGTRVFVDSTGANG